MSRINQIGQLIEGNLTDEVLIIPEKHREVEHALKNGLQNVELENFYTDNSIVFKVTIPKGSIWDSTEFDNSEIEFNVIVQNRRTNIAQEENRTLWLPKVEGGCSLAVSFAKAPYEDINLNSVRLLKAGRINTNLI